MDVLLSLKDKKSKSNWRRMLNAFNTLSESKHNTTPHPDARLKAGKGWVVENMDAERISDVLTKEGVEFNRISDYNIEIV